MRASLSRFALNLSLLMLLLLCATKECVRSKRTYSLLFEFLSRGNFFHRTALNSAVQRNHRKEICAHKSITPFAVGSERTNAHLHIKMGFANVWGSHPKDNAKGGRAWYVGDVLFPNETREIFFSLFCAFFFFRAAAETP